MEQRAAQYLCRPEASLSDTPARPVALVTGASSGIGLAYARALGVRGYDLLLVSNEQQRLDDAAAELSETCGVRATALCVDLARPEAARELYDHCEAAKIEVDVLVNNAGIFFFDDVTATDPALISKMVVLHIQTVTLLCRFFGAAMQRRGRGYILNMASLSAWTPAPGISVYAASKSYIRKFSKVLRLELRDSGVGVTTVCPGAVATELYNLSERYQRLALRLGVMMTPERLAEKGLRALFARRDYIVPGAINRLFALLVYLLPEGLICTVKRHTKLYRYGR